MNYENELVSCLEFIEVMTSPDARGKTGANFFISNLEWTG